jgi:hypothetical protein
MISDELDAQPPNAAPSTTIPRIRILVVPGPTGIQPQPEVEGKGERKKGAPPRVAQLSSASPAGMITGTSSRISTRPMSIKVRKSFGSTGVASDACPIDADGVFVFQMDGAD